VHQRLPGEHLERFVVEHVAGGVVGVDQAVLSVAGVGVEGDVGNHAQFRELLFQRRTTRGTRPFGL
jgi:hypothetical protein